MATVRIGHASTSNPASGLAADEVRISNYYKESSKPWLFVLHPKTRVLAEKSAAICEAGCNNNYVRYSQASRHTLKTKALNAAGLSDSNENIAKLTADHITNIKEVCHADCSSFMTLCAIAGGAKFSYGSNAATTSTMRARFTEFGDYEVLTAQIYLNSSDYLRRGDILVNNGHTVMVLDNGKNAVVSPDEEYAGLDQGYLDITTIRIVTTITKISSTKMSAEVKITKISKGEENDLKNSSELDLYKWSYIVSPLKNSNEEIISETLKITSATKSFSVSNLKPNHPYVLRIAAIEKNGQTELSSSNIFFTTPQSYPKAVTNLAISFDTKFTDKSFTISFNSPDSWGNNALQKCYKLSLLVNGKVVATNDSILSTSDSYVFNKKIKLSSITSKDDLFAPGDIIQIGVQPCLKDTEGNFIYDSSALRCSKPLYIKSSLIMIDKLFIKVKDIFNRVIIYNNK